MPGRDAFDTYKNGDELKTALGFLIDLKGLSTVKSTGDVAILGELATEFTKIEMDSVKLHDMRLNYFDASDAGKWDIKKVTSKIIKLDNSFFEKQTDIIPKVGSVNPEEIGPLTKKNIINFAKQMMITLASKLQEAKNSGLSTPTVTKLGDFYNCQLNNAALNPAHYANSLPAQNVTSSPLRRR